MIKITLILILFLILPVSAGAEEPAEKLLSFYLGAGLTFPVSPEPFRRAHNAGINVYTALGYSVSPFTEFLGRLEFHTVSLDSGKQFGNDVNFSGGGLDILLVGADVRFSTVKSAASLQPFATLGAGITRMSQSNIITDLALEQYAALLIENQTKLYFSLGAGINFKPASNTTMFLIARYINVSQDADNMIFLPVALGFKF